MFIFLDKALGTTKKGIGPTYQAKAGRFGIRIGDLKNWDSFLKKYHYLNDRVKEDGHKEIDRESELR